MDGKHLLDEAEQASIATVQRWRAEVNATAGQAASPRIQQGLIQELEYLKDAITARQIKLTAASSEDTRARRPGIPHDRSDRHTGVGVAFARRRHPVAGQRLVHQARVIVGEMPSVLAAMRAGHLNEEAAAVLVRETEGLNPAARAQTAQELQDRWQYLGERGLREAARGIVTRLDPDLAKVRAIAAAEDRHVTWRSAPDSMMRLSALVPATTGLGCVQALQSAAQAAIKEKGAEKVTQQDRRRAEADALVALITGAESGQQPPVDVRVNLMIPIEALTGDAPGVLDGYGTISGHLARDLITACPDEQGPAIRRIFTAPEHQELIGMESTSRSYTGLLREFIRLRDQRCRTPYCESPAKHTDHIQPAATGGPTTAGNGRVTCAGCNYDKEDPDYHVTGDAGQVICTVGGVSVRSQPPQPPSSSPPTTVFGFERKFIDIIWHGFTTPRRE
ncbi:DUF222 domain-containing protein [Branchiibius sp. NY16-3462-2]|uniref:HNH endonuclease n=1 Tax=Branchiibius sp. NY16-3462-2 TaxID=1807500 RepID=UPI0007950311|nr:DUF222 domain-containing protein [Branchiibius sp. NY16-3462-2]KYH45109.1 hypothetical protein AZH51_14590 [Branchiibius sp. NY16-3462-2]